MQPRLYPYAPERDVYRLLQVEPSAEPDEIMAAIRRLARTFHPDRNGSPRAAEEMQVVYAVRNLLVDPHARARYDHARHRFLAENAAIRRRAAGPGADDGVKRPASTRRSRPIASRFGVTSRALVAAFRAMLDAFAPARGRLLTTSADVVPPPTPMATAAAREEPATQPVGIKPAAQPPAPPAVSWEADGEVVLDPELVAAEVAVMPVPSAAPALLWDPDGEVVLEPVAMVLPPMAPLPIRPMTVAIPVGEPRQEPVAARLAAVPGTFWESSARAVAAAVSEVGVQECGHCGIALSASARFCRRCGTTQARSA